MTQLKPLRSVCWESEIFVNSREGVGLLFAVRCVPPGVYDVLYLLVIDRV